MPQTFQPGDTAQPSDQQSIWILAILSALMAFASVSTDLYLTAMPVMAQSLHADAGQLEFTITASAGGFFYGGMYAYIAGTPFAYIDFYHVSPQTYGILFGVGIVGIMLTNQVNARWVKQQGSDRLMRLGALVAAVAGISLAVDAQWAIGGLVGLVVPLFFFVAAAGLIVANSIVGALNNFPHVAGSVSALIGALQYGTGIMGSGMVGMLADGTPIPMAMVIAAFGGASALCAIWAVKSKSESAIQVSIAGSGVK